MGTLTELGAERRQIAAVEQSLAEHRESHVQYLQTAQSRVNIFSQITKLVDDARNTKLPVDSQNPTNEAEPDPTPMELDEVSAPRLSAQALPFQPTTSMRPPSTLPARPARPSGPAADGLAKLPTAPSRTVSSNLPPAPPPSRSTSSSLPNRPSALKSSTTPGRGKHSLEEGEVSGEEDGEVAETGARRRRL